MSLYLDRYAWPEVLFPDFMPPQDLELIVVIPCYNEPDIETALLSLNNCQATDNILVILVVNESEVENESIRSQNQRTIASAKTLNLKYDLKIAYLQLPKKKAGVGLARKIGMDEAVRVFRHLQKDGIIACYDADCSCEANYLSVIKEFFKGPFECGVVHYEHDLTQNTTTIIDYEIHLRYYIDALRWAGFTNAFQTLGSCIIVKSERYEKEGGMNTRKAGEDFYFLHKVIPNGKFGEINSTTVYPSARISDRVPFGTGHAVAKNIDAQDYFTYNPLIFVELKQIIDQLDVVHGQKEISISDEVRKHFDLIQFQSNIDRILQESSDLKDFKRRFFRWFDGFKTLKLVHHLRDTTYPNVNLTSALDWMIEQEMIDDGHSNRLEMLEEMRFKNRSNWYGQ